MNRQMRRIQKKAEEKQYAERDKFKAKRSEKRQRVLSRRRERLASSSNSNKSNNNNAGGLHKTKVGRFSGIFLLVVAAFIILQAVLPRPEEGEGGISQFSFVIEVLYYVLFGYFAYLWLARRNQPNAFPIAGAAGAILALLLQGLLFALPNLEPNLQLLALAIPGSVLGAFLAQLVYSRAT
ncbi:MAG: hypothetical protein ACRCYY_10030 [Trueperaceae bacterium]